MVELSLEHPKSGGMAAAALLKTKEASPEGTILLSQQKGGPKLPVSIGRAPGKESSKVVPSSSIVSIQKELNLSNNQTASLTTMLNSARADGKKIVETGTREKLASRVTEMADLHARTTITVDGETYEGLHITNLRAFIDHVLERSSSQRRYRSHQFGLRTEISKTVHESNRNGYSRRSHAVWEAAENPTSW